MKDAVVYLNPRGVSFALVTSGPWDEMARYIEFLGYTQPFYSVRRVEPAIGSDMGHLVCFLRDDNRVSLTYSTTGRGNEVSSPSFGLLDMTPYGRDEAWEDNPEGWPVIGGEARWYCGRTPTAKPPGAHPAGQCGSGPDPARPWNGP